MSAIIYCLIVAVGIALLAIRRFRANIWWLAFFSAAIYDLPIAFGIDIWRVPIPKLVTIVALTVLASLLLICAFVKPAPVPAEVPIQKNSWLVRASAFICFASFLALIAAYGSSIFFVHKTESGISGYFYILWRLSSSYAVVISVLARRYKLALIVSVPLLATLFAGDRTAVGLTMITLLWLLLQDNRLSMKWFGLVSVGSILLGVFLFFGKTFQALWWSGAYSLGEMVKVLVSQGSDAITQTEPFATVGVFGALTTITREPPGSLIIDMAAQLLIVPSAFGFESTAFNAFFQPILFPYYREQSLAYSYWGEGYVRGGLFGVLGFFLAFIAGLKLFDKLVLSRSLALRSFAYVGGGYFAFYIHRNSMVSMLAYQRQIILFALALGCLAWILRSMNRRIST